MSVEYKIINPFNSTSEEFQKEINNLAKDRWKIYTVGFSHSGFIISIILEREANSESELGLLSFEKTK